MESTNGAGRPLGALLLEGGVVNEAQVELALADQQLAGKRLGEILIERDLISRPLLTRVLAQQDGIVLDEEGGFGSGLRALIERRHQERSRRLQAGAPTSKPEPTPEECMPSSTSNELRFAERKAAWLRAR